MSKSLTVFDYGSVDKDAGGKLRYLAGEIKKVSKQHKQSGLQIGESVAKAHAILATDGKEGQFSAWIEAECGFGRTTAYNYMWAWGKFSECPSIEQYEVSAMYALASPKAPDEAFKEAEKLAKKGERITADKAKELLDKFRDVAKKSAPNKEVKGSIVQPLNNSTKSQASATGTPATSNGSPPDLPSVGTVNRTESGSQDSGDAGECPKGGDHEWDDGGTCHKCFDPDGPCRMPEVVPLEGGDSFDPANIEAHAESFAANFAAKVKAHNLEIERFARSIMEAFANPPASVWLDESRLGIALDQIKSACATIRQAKAHDKPCPKCDGKGTITGKDCKRCKGVGYMPERTYEMAGGQ